MPNHFCDDMLTFRDGPKCKDENTCDFADPMLIEKLRNIQPSPPLDVAGTIVAEETETIIGDLPRGTCNGPLFGDIEPIYNATISANLKPESIGEYIDSDSNSQSESEDDEDSDDENSDENSEEDSDEESNDEVSNEDSDSDEDNGSNESSDEDSDEDSGEDDDEDSDEESEQSEDEDCVDVNKFIWSKKSNGKNKKQKCSWVEEKLGKNDSFCDKETVEGILIGEHCPETCGWCESESTANNKSVARNIPLLGAEP